MRETTKDIFSSDLKDGPEDSVLQIQDLLSNLSLKNKVQLEEADDFKNIDNLEKFNDQVEGNKLTESSSDSEDDNEAEQPKELQIQNEEETSLKSEDASKSFPSKLQETDSKDSKEETLDNNLNTEQSHAEGVNELKVKFSLFELDDKRESEDEDDAENEEEEDEEEEEKTSYLKRGPVTEHRNQGYRFSPMQPQSVSSYNQSSSFYNSPSHDSSSLFDLVEFSQISGPDGVSQDYGLNQSYYENTDGNFNNSCLSPESVHSTNSFSPFYTPDFPCNISPNEHQFPSEISDSSFTLDFGIKGYDSYQPLSPPKSVSPLLKEGLDSTENLKESEDLINIIDSVNKTYNTNAEGIPESELVKLRSALEGNEDSIRNEMGVYLKNNAPFQSSFSNSDDSASNFTFNFDAPLTPPKSISPFQKNLQYDSSNSPFSEFQDGGDVDYSQSDKNLNDILHGIDEINPEELDIYLDKETNSYDPSYAKNIIQSRCKPSSLDHALRRLSSISTKYLCKKDGDGDTCLMIVYSKPEDSPDFYENIFCLQEKVREIRVCCDIPLGKAKKCKICGNCDSDKFYTPLSLKNKQGDTALSCAIKTDHSSVIISYLLDAILQCPEDFRRVFDEKGKTMLTDAAYKYRFLRQYL